MLIPTSAQLQKQFDNLNRRITALEEQAKNLRYSTAVREGLEFEARKLRWEKQRLEVRIVDIRQMEKTGVAVAVHKGGQTKIF